MSRWKHDLDDEDRANLSHLMKLADVLQTQAPIDIIEWNKALNEVQVKPKAKKEPKPEDVQEEEEMSETWVFNTKDSDKLIDFAAKGIYEGWLVSVYRVPEEEKRAIRADKKLSNEMMHEIFDQDAL